MDFTQYHSPTTTMWVAGLLGLIYLGMSIRIVFFRFSKKISLGVPSSDQDPMFKANRIHANFSEYVPLILVMMTLLEITGTPTIHLQLSGSFLIAARLLHWIGIRMKKVPNPYRFIGAATTFSILGYFSIALILKGIA